MRIAYSKIIKKPNERSDNEKNSKTKDIQNLNSMLEFLICYETFNGRHLELLLSFPFFFHVLVI